MERGNCLFDVGEDVNKGLNVDLYPLGDTSADNNDFGTVIGLGSIFGLLNILLLTEVLYLVICFGRSIKLSLQVIFFFGCRLRDVLYFVICFFFTVGLLGISLFVFVKTSSSSFNWLII